MSLPTQFFTKNVMLIFITYNLSIEYHGIYYTNTISNRMNECLTTPKHEKQIGYWVSDQIKSKQHFMTTSPLPCVTNGIEDFVKCCIKMHTYITILCGGRSFSLLTRPSLIQVAQKNPTTHKHSTFRSQPEIRYVQARKTRSFLFA